MKLSEFNAHLWLSRTTTQRAIRLQRHALAERQQTTESLGQAFVALVGWLSILAFAFCIACMYV